MPGNAKRNTRTIHRLRVMSGAIFQSCADGLLHSRGKIRGRGTPGAFGKTNNKTKN